MKLLEKHPVGLGSRLLIEVESDAEERALIAHVYHFAPPNGHSPSSPSSFILDAQEALPVIHSQTKRPGRTCSPELRAHLRSLMKEKWAPGGTLRKASKTWHLNKPYRNGKPIPLLEIPDES